jgi:hypothetical protein
MSAAQDQNPTKKLLLKSMDEILLSDTNKETRSVLSIYLALLRISLLGVL